MNRIFFRRPAIAGALVALLVILAGCSQSDEDATRPSPSAGADVAVDRSLLTEIGLSAFANPPEGEAFSLATLDGSTTALSDYRGSWVLLNFWATWCGPCVAEMPSMERLYGQFKDDGLVIVGVNQQESVDEVAAFVAERGLTFPILLDSNGRVGSRYGVRGIPTTYLIDPSGRVLGSKVGFMEWDEDHVVAAIRSLIDR
jgi:peroxiredoxin